MIDDGSNGNSKSTNVHFVLGSDKIKDDALYKSLVEFLEEARKGTHCPKWDMAFNLICLENNLINHRITSFLAVNAFLFSAGLVIAEKVFCSSSVMDKSDWMRILLLFIIIAVGIYSCFIASSGINAASRQILTASNWFKMTISSTDSHIFSTCSGEHNPTDNSADGKGKWKSDDQHKLINKDLLKYPPLVGRKTAAFTASIRNRNKSYIDYYLLTDSEVQDLSKLSTMDLSGFNEQKKMKYAERLKQYTDKIDDLSAGIIHMPKLILFAWTSILLLLIGCIIVRRFY